MLMAQAAAAGRVLLCTWAIVLIIVTLIGAVILRAACSLYNKMAGGRQSASAIPEPSFGAAMGIVFVTLLVNLGISMLMGFVVGSMGDRASAAVPMLLILGWMCSLSVSYVVLSGMITVMLPTTFPRAMLVALLHTVIGILLALAIGAVVFVVLTVQRLA